MFQRKQSGLLGSRALLIGMMAATSILGFTWYITARSMRAPEIPGYDWHTHPIALLIVDRPDCGCSLSASQWAFQGLVHNLDVLVVSVKPVDGIDRMQAGSGHGHLTLFQPADQRFIDRLTPDGRTIAMVIRNGYITRSFQARGDLAAALRE